MNIGERIKARRKELKMSADKLAEKIGKDRSTIFRYEKGDIENLPLDILEPIALALNTTPQYLMGWVSEEVHRKNDVLANIVLTLRKDDELLSMVEALSKLDAEKRQAVMSVLRAFEVTGK